jgi:hypothetical protein
MTYNKKIFRTYTFFKQNIANFSPYMQIFQKYPTFSLIIKIFPEKTKFSGGLSSPTFTSGVGL